MKQVLYFLSLGVFLHSCKSKETVTPNRPLSAFTVTQTLKSDGKTIVLNWTKAKDPDGDAVTYAVVLNDTLVKNISDTTYTIANLDFNYNQAGKVIAKDAKGLISEASFMATTKKITFVSIPDANFEKYLIDKKIDKDGLVNGRIGLVDAKGIKELDLRPIDMQSLVGIEAFTDLEKLSYGSTFGPFPYKLSSLDISKNTELEYLWLGGVQLLNEINLSENTNLKSLTVIYSGLLSLDITKNIKLEYLELYSSSLTDLDFSKNLNLESLACSRGLLNNLDISNNINLKFLACSDNKLTSLDVSKNANLNVLACNSNKLSILDVSQNTNLKKLYCEFNKLTNLNLENNILLEFIWCYVNNFTSLNLCKNAKIKELRCQENKLLKNIYVADVANVNREWQKDPIAKYEVCK